MKPRESQELPSEQLQDAQNQVATDGANLALTTSAPRWVCDKCHAVAFDEYETAVAHEKICKGPGKVLTADTNATVDPQQDQEVAAKHENISKKRGLDLATDIICVEDPQHDQEAAVAHENISKEPGLDLTADISVDEDQEAASTHENISKERGLDLTTDISVDEDPQQDQSQTISPPAKKRLRKKSPEKLKEQYSQNTLVDSNQDQDNEAPSDEICSKASEDYSIDANVDVNDSSDNGEDDDSSKDVPSTPPRKLPPPTVSGSSVEFHLEPVRPHLICSLCDGYFRDPYTITECLHSFCKSCLFYAFAEGFRGCPRCQISLSPDPKKKVLSDRTLQEVVDTLFPDLKEKDEEDEKAFYAQRGIKLQEEYRVDTKVTQNSGTLACVSTFQSQMRSQIPVTQMSQRKVSEAQVS